MRWLWAFVIALLLSSPFLAKAATIGKQGGLALVNKGGITAEGVALNAGRDFGRLLEQPTTALTGGDTVFQDLLSMPFKPKDFPADKATAKSFITGKNLAKALRGGVGAYVAGEAIAALIKAACVRGMGGSLVMNESATFEECVPNQQSGPWSIKPAGGNGIEFKGPTKESVFAQLDAWWTAGNPSRSTKPDGTSNYIFQCSAPGGNNCYTFAEAKFDSGAPPPPPPGEQTYRPISTADLDTKLENAIKDPANASKVIPALKELIDKGGQVEVSPPTLSGPASSPVSTSQSTSITNTTNGPVTITSTTTNVTNYTYNGSTVTASQVTNTTKKDAAGNTIESTTTSTPPEQTASSDTTEGSPSDTPLPPVPDLYVRKYPDGMEGIWNQYKDQLKNTQFMQLIGKLMPTVADGGTCPAWPMNLSMAAWADYGTHDVAPPCWIWDAAAAVLVVSALLLARRLVFGG